MSSKSPSSDAAPRVVPRSDHSISRKDIDPDALRVLYRLHHSGYTAYLVGGGVRDLLLGRKPKDFDVGTNAHPQQVRKLFRNCFLIGRRFRLAHIKFGSKVIETCTFRRQPDGDFEPGEFHERDNTFGTPEEDARRRDFTINGIFYDIKSFSVIDHVGGLADLDARTIRTIGDPEIRFREDPVRMVRAIRFASRLGFTVEPTTWNAILKHHAEIAKASSARMLEEIYRLFPFGSGEKSFRLLEESGLMSVMFPELLAAIGSNHSIRDRFWRLLAQLDRNQQAPSPVLIFSCLALPVFQAHVESAGESIPQEHMYESVRTLLRPLALRYSMPKAVFFGTVSALVLQSELAGKPDHAAAGKRHSRESRLMQSEDFPHILAFRETLVRALHGHSDVITEWKNLYDQHSVHLEPRHHGRHREHHHDEHPHGGVPAHREHRRRRRPRRRHHASHEPPPDAHAQKSRDPLWRRVLRRFRS